MPFGPASTSTDSSISALINCSPTPTARDSGPCLADPAIAPSATKTSAGMARPSVLASAHPLYGRAQVGDRHFKIYKSGTTPCAAWPAPTSLGEEILAWHTTKGCSDGPTEAVNVLILSPATSMKPP